MISTDGDDCGGRCLTSLSVVTLHYMVLQCGGQSPGLVNKIAAQAFDSGFYTEVSHCNIQLRIIASYF